jgi:hypothetical protein
VNSKVRNKNSLVSLGLDRVCRLSVLSLIQLKVYPEFIDRCLSCCYSAGMVVS